MSSSSPSEFLTFYRTIRATSKFTQTTSQCLARPVTIRPFSSSTPKAKATNLEDTKMKRSSNLEDTLTGVRKRSSNLEDTLIGVSKRALNLEDNLLGR